MNAGVKSKTIRPRIKSNYKTKKTARKGISIFSNIIFIALLLHSLLLMILIFWGVTTALKTQSEFLDNALLPVSTPLNWAWENFQTIIREFYVPVTKDIGGIPVPYKVGIFEQLFNTIMYAGVCAFLQALVPCIIAYATSRFKYKFSSVIHYTVILVMIIPIVGNIPSELHLMRSIGLFDTFLGSWIQKFNFVNMYYLVFYAAFKGVPTTFSEAAYIDGASEFKVLISIMLPLVRTALLTVMLLCFINFWNDYQTPLLFLPTKPVLSYGVFVLSNSAVQELNTVPMRMTGCILMVIPTLTLFLVFRNQIMGNLTIGGIKE